MGELHLEIVINFWDARIFIERVFKKNFIQLVSFILFRYFFILSVCSEAAASSLQTTSHKLIKQDTRLSPTNRAMHCAICNGVVDPLKRTSLHSLPRRICSL